MERILLTIGEFYEKRFKEMLNMNIYKDFNKNILFCSYVFNNNLIKFKDLKKFKSNITESGLKKIIEIIQTIEILEGDYIKNRKIIFNLNKLLIFYMNIENN